MTEAAYRTAEELLDENKELRTEIARLRAEVIRLEKEKTAAKYAMADWAGEVRSCWHRLGGVARMAEVSAMDTSEGHNDA